MSTYLKDWPPPTGRTNPQPPEPSEQFTPIDAVIAMVAIILMGCGTYIALSKLVAFMVKHAL